jgi:hypothetical protein
MLTADDLPEPRFVAPETKHETPHLEGLEGLLLVVAAAWVELVLAAWAPLLRTGE